MDAEQRIAEIECLERIFAVPDTRPLSPSDLSAANRHNVSSTNEKFKGGTGKKSDPARQANRARTVQSAFPAASAWNPYISRVLSEKQIQEESSQSLLLQETRLPADDFNGVALGQCAKQALIVPRRKCRLKQRARIYFWHTPEGPSFPRMKGGRILQSMWHVSIRSGLIRMD